MMIQSWKNLSAKEIRKELQLRKIPDKKKRAFLKKPKLIEFIQELINEGLL